jgi:hypothetical protein
MKQTSFILVLLSFWGVSVFAQNSPKLLAHYPLTKNNQGVGNKIAPLNLLGVSFREGAAECLGMYDNFEEGKGVSIFASPIEGFDLYNFSVSVDFKVSKTTQMPVFVIDSDCRAFGFYLSESGRIMLKANNGDFIQESKFSYQINTWQTATLVYQNKTAILYLNRKEILRSSVELEPCSFSQDISTVDFGSGSVFSGFWRNLKIYKGAWTPQVKEETQTPPNTTTPPNNNSNASNTTQSNSSSNTTLNSTSVGKWKQIEIPVNASPGDIAIEGNNSRRIFHLLKNKANQLEIIWQDKVELSLFLSNFDKNLQNAKHISLPIESNEILLAATNDENDNYYYATYQNNRKNKQNDVLVLYKADKSGKLLVRQAQNSDKNNLDIFDMKLYAGALAYQKGFLCLMIGRIMNKSSDGLNHQGGIATIFDANTLQTHKHFGQTSGHSFDNFLTTAQSGEFIGMDLGDNYPRGIHLHRMTNNDRRSKVVYTFKTFHGTTAQSPAGDTYPRYDAISTPQQTFYQWSNDNNTYTELGAIVEVPDSYFVFFAGEYDNQKRSLNNARAVDFIKANVDSRNLGFVRVKKDFSSSKSLQEIILSKGIAEKGGFYTFGGRWTELENYGVTWLTNYNNAEKENVKHIKAVLLPNGNILVIYVVDSVSSNPWKVTDENKQVFMTMLDAQGNTLLQPTALDKSIKLNKRDEIIVLNNQVISVFGTKDKKLILNVLELK